MSEQLATLLPAAWADMQHPHALWQAGVLLLCLIIGPVLARLLRRAAAPEDSATSMAGKRAEILAPVLAPLLALTALALVTPLLAYWQPVNVLRLALPLVASFALIRLAFYILRRAFLHAGRAGKTVLMFEKLLASVAWVGVALYITGLWPGLVQAMSQIVLPIGRHQVSLLIVAQAAASVVVTIMVALWAGALLEKRLMQLDTMHSSLRAVMARMGRAVLILVAVLLSLSLVGIDLTVLSVFGGALGVGLGLGLQKIVSSYVSGFVILLERSLAIGDLVTVDRYSGQVTQINTRYTVVRGLDGIETVVPNEMLISGPVQNHSLTDRSVRLATRLSVGYKTDVDQVLEVLREAAAGVERVAVEPAPQALLLGFGADGLELEVGFWILDPENGRANVVSQVNRAIWKVLQEQQIEIPYPQREIRVLDNKEASRTLISARERSAIAG